jgi:phosphoribosyl-ATP pyrophosphohydrolase/phosphoribosyl-AMP cyclohydrolase
MARDDNMEMKLDEKGLMPAIVQDAGTGQVLTLAYMSPESLKRTLETGQVWFYSRSRQELWHKGATSGNYLNVKEVWADCDADAILVKVDPVGPACHTGEHSCFFNRVQEEPSGYNSAEPGTGILDELFAVIQQRQETMPEGSYTAQLFKDGVPFAAQKVVEEGGEVAIAAVRGDKTHITEEAADLLYHLLVLLAASGVRPKAVWQELTSRRRQA